MPPCSTNMQAPIIGKLQPPFPQPFSGARAQRRLQQCHESNDYLRARGQVLTEIHERARAQADHNYDE